MTGGWLYILADRSRGTLTVGVAADVVRRLGAGGAAEAEGHGLMFCEWVAERPHAKAWCARLRRGPAHRMEDLIDTQNPGRQDLFPLMASGIAGLMAEQVVGV